MTIDDLRSSKSATITLRDAADTLGVDPRTVTAGISQGTIPSLKVGKRVLIPREKFLALFETAAA